MKNKGISLKGLSMVFIDRAIFSWWLAVSALFLGAMVPWAIAVSEPQPKPRPLTQELSDDHEMALSMIKTYETELASGKKSPMLLHNLAVLYLKLGSFEQSLAIWLGLRSMDRTFEGIDSGVQHSLVQAALPETLTSWVHLSGHGPWTTLMSEVDDRSVVILAQASLFFTCCCCVLLLMLQWGKWLWLAQVGSYVKRLIYFLGFVSVFGWISVYVLRDQKGFWAVVEAPSIVLYQDALMTKPWTMEDGSNPYTLKMGTPVFLNRDTFASVLLVYTHDGRQGYLQSLDLRFIR